MYLHLPASFLQRMLSAVCCRFAPWRRARSDIRFLPDIPALSSHSGSGFSTPFTIIVTLLTFLSYLILIEKRVQERHTRGGVPLPELSFILRYRYSISWLANSFYHKMELPQQLHVMFSTSVPTLALSKSGIRVETCRFPLSRLQPAPRFCYIIMIGRNPPHVK